jgi:hypothetical protein
MDFIPNRDDISKNNDWNQNPGSIDDPKKNDSDNLKSIPMKSRE